MAMHRQLEEWATLARSKGWTVEQSSKSRVQWRDAAGKLMTVTSVHPYEKDIQNTKSILRRQGLFDDDPEAKETEMAGSKTEELIATAERHNYRVDRGPRSITFYYPDGRRVCGIALNNGRAVRGRVGDAIRSLVGANLPVSNHLREYAGLPANITVRQPEPKEEPEPMAATDVATTDLAEVVNLLDQMVQELTEDFARFRDTTQTSLTEIRGSVHQINQKLNAQPSTNGYVTAADFKKAIADIERAMNSQLAAIAATAKVDPMAEFRKKLGRA